MADKLTELQREFNGASLEARIAYDKLQKWNTFPNDLLRERKDEYEAIQKAYNDAQAKKNLARKALEAAKKEQNKSKEAKAAETVYNKTLSALEKAALGIAGYKGQEKYIAAYQAAQDAYKNVTEKGRTPSKPLPEPKIELPAANQQGATGAEGGKIEGPVNYVDALTYLTDPKHKESLIQAQKALTAFGYKGNTKGEPDATFTAALRQAAQEYAGIPANWRNGNLLDYIYSPISGGAGAGTGTGTGGSQYDPYATLSVWDKVKTKAELNTLYQSLLDRDATPEEVDAAYNKLQQKQKEQKATVTKYKVINGVRTAVTTPGFNQGEYLTDLVKSTKEYKDSVKKKETEKTSAAEITKQDLMKTAMANGISLTPEQLTDFQARIDAGEKTDAIKNTIRQIASLGLPDHVKQIVASGVDLATVYAPYKTTLAQTLELNPASITLDDPTLRMAIGPDKEMSLYEYQRALRKDNRWQYTDQARTEASDVAKTVLRDFGFMG